MERSSRKEREIAAIELSSENELYPIEGIGAIDSATAVPSLLFN